MTSSTDKRQNVRALFSAQARVKLLNAEQSKRFRKLKRQLDHQSEPPFTNLDSMASDANVRLGSLLMQIDDKLDRILSLLEKQPAIKQKDELVVENTVDISGSGIGLILNGPAEKKQIVEMELCIPGFPLNKINLFGEITRVAPYDQGGNNLLEVGIEFLNLDERDRERLIAYSFSQQRKQIRESKK